MAQVITLKITYADCDSRIWREAQISDNSYLNKLGYMVLATFDTLVYHLFSIEYNGVLFELPSDDRRIKPEECLFYVKLKDLNLNIGDKLQMIYDFGCEQVFDIEVTDISPMPRGTGTAYPKILRGEGRGVLDNVSAWETLEIIKQIDKTGKSEHSVQTEYGSQFWAYRDYRLDLDNGLLKGEIARIEDAYSSFEQFMEE
ncbi:MAG: hypothetical protein PUA85_01645 [Oscillospiraceae bacterium]|nr:hypothetical protein [Oscillospiraceae bacterium]